MTKETRTASGTRIYFLGSGGIGIPTLSTLLDADSVEVAGIGTQPPRAAGRRRRTNRPTPVGEFAARRGLAADTPRSVNDPSFLKHLEAIEADLLIVAAFGQILGKEVLALPQQGCLNVHASLLPRHRGAAPVSAAILAGDDTTGVSFMQMDQGLDTGPVYEQHRIGIDARETRPSLEQKLAQAAASNIVGCIERIRAGATVPAAQDESRATCAPRLTKKDGQINWSNTANYIERKVRAFLPWPRAWFIVSTGKKQCRIQVTEARLCENTQEDAAPGAVLQADKNAWVIACGDGALELTKVIPEGKSEMTGPEFLRGNPLQPGNMAESATGNQDPHYETTADQLSRVGKPGSTG